MSETEGEGDTLEERVARLEEELAALKRRFENTLEVNEMWDGS